VESPIAKRLKSAHLMCRTKFWGICAAAASCYFAYLSYSDLRHGDFEWQHEWWTVLTWAVWLVLLAGLLTETRCRRERTFFALVLVNIALALTFALWSSAGMSTVLRAREFSLVLWILSALASLTTLKRPACDQNLVETEAHSVSTHV
jgi:hypothetical protein